MVYKSLVRNKKRCAVATLHSELMEFMSKNPREFWRKISKVTKQSKDDEIPIPVEEIGAHFKSLLEGLGNSPHVSSLPGFETDPINFGRSYH